MITRCQAFYGGSPMDWFRMPMEILERVFWSRLNQLQCEHTLNNAAVVMVGTGSMKEDDAKTLLRSWREGAGIDSGPVMKLGDMSPDERREFLEGQGIVVG